jgi:glycine cleavage system H protein
MIPTNLHYTRDHEWVKIENGIAVVGITDFAQHALGDITFVDAPKVGKKVAAHGELGVIESVKAASDFFAPVGGTVVETNPDLIAHPELINQDPYGKGWICYLDHIDTAELSNLMDAAHYEQYIAGKE